MIYPSWLNDADWRAWTVYVQFTILLMKAPLGKARYKETVHLKVNL